MLAVSAEMPPFARRVRRNGALEHREQPRRLRRSSLTAVRTQRLMFVHRRTAAASPLLGHWVQLRRSAAPAAAPSPCPGPRLVCGRQVRAPPWQVPRVPQVPPLTPSAGCTRSPAGRAGRTGAPPGPPCCRSAAGPGCEGRRAGSFPLSPRSRRR